MNTFTWINLMLTIALVGSIFTKIWTIWRWNRKETIAVILDKDGKTLHHQPLKKIKTPFFSYMDGSYNIPSDVKAVDSVVYKRKRMIIYTVGNPDPVPLVWKIAPKFPAQTYHVILKNEAVKAINRPEGMFANLDVKKVLMFAGIGIGAYLILSQILA